MGVLQQAGSLWCNMADNAPGRFLLVKKNNQMPHQMSPKSLPGTPGRFGDPFTIGEPASTLGHSSSHEYEVIRSPNEVIFELFLSMS